MTRKMAFDVDGVTCGLCIGDIMERVRVVPGVLEISVGPVHDGHSHVQVTSESTTRLAWLAKALAGAGCPVAIEMTRRRWTRQSDHRRAEGTAGCRGRWDRDRPGGLDGCRECAEPALAVCGARGVPDDQGRDAAPAWSTTSRRPSEVRR
jgi:copper chaperone CopZ